MLVMRCLSWRPASDLGARRAQPLQSWTANRSNLPLRKDDRRATIQKNIRSRKRHISTDADGRLLSIGLHGANIQDRHSASGGLKRLRAQFSFVARLRRG